MRTRLRTLLVPLALSALMTGLLAVPTLAAGVHEAGSGGGSFFVGSSRTGCTSDGTDTVSGPGITAQPATQRYYALRATTDSVSTAGHWGIADLALCGTLVPGLRGGISCFVSDPTSIGDSASSDGHGRVTVRDSAGAHTWWITNLTWTTAAPSYGWAIAATGKAYAHDPAITASAPKSFSLTLHTTPRCGETMSAVAGYAITD